MSQERVSDDVQLRMTTVGGIDSQRIASLVDYLAEYADHLVVALLPEDARALDTDYTRITDI